MMRKHGQETMSYNLRLHRPSVFRLLIKAADLLLMGRRNKSLYPQKLFKLFTVLATSLLKGDYPF